jgi:hypothetical protein
MRLVTFAISGGGGRNVHLNPDQVVCLLESGIGRTQIVTTGLAGETAVSLIVDGDPGEVARRLGTDSAQTAASGSAG